ncbi:MAG TPA: cohesin domain-containing protein [Blastocatellia bacterium]|nr:cohesin domain-containing protein [Blastocatellia bacterium]HMV85332.1 cohesin domain-containing protein [Blastocatellia bacterium]HMX29195.1 cohesin domain-containing protein [Blastocatellia bacterium]HMY71292.1 cohesin domain-containing protein [Blastocatellia bacterium]HMZ20090.1 cohesin domain-containing protein [Blastocatellia bacterium]
MTPFRFALLVLILLSLFSLPQQTNPRSVRVAAASGVVGGNLSVPVELISQGDENAVSFTLTFDPALLTNPQVELGSAATGSLLTVNPNQAAQGRVGVVLSLPAGQQFNVGVRQIAVVGFKIPANAAVGTTSVGFGDQPVRREVVDPNARSLSADFLSRQVLITPEGFEADAAPRPNGNNDGNVTLADFVQVGRFVAGLDVPDMAGEFQRADCAPLNTLGDGRLTITDWAQAGRYVAGLDAARRAGGLAAPLPNALPNESNLNEQTAIHLNVDDFNAANAARERTAAITLDAQGGENALGFSLSFNPAHWRFVVAETEVAAVTLLVNAEQSALGRIGLALALPAGRNFERGERRLVRLRFSAVAKAAPLTIKFADSPVTREVANVNARALPSRFVIAGDLLVRRF